MRPRAARQTLSTTKPAHLAFNDVVKRSAPNAPSGRSPDAAASSPISALPGASRMPLLMRSNTLPARVEATLGSRLQTLEAQPALCNQQGKGCFRCCAMHVALLPTTIYLLYLPRKCYAVSSTNLQWQTIYLEKQAQSLTQKGHRGLPLLAEQPATCTQQHRLPHGACRGCLEQISSHPLSNAACIDMI